MVGLSPRPERPSHRIAPRTRYVPGTTHTIRTTTAATDTAMAMQLLKLMFVPTAGAASAHPGYYALLVLAACWASAGSNAWDALDNYHWKPLHGLVFAGVFGACLAVIAGGRASPFLYFQF